MRLVYILLQTEWQLFILAFVSFSLVFFNKINLAKWIGAISFFYLFVLCKTPLSDNWLETIESRYPPLNISQLDTSYNYHIVVLGSGATYDPDLPPNSWMDAVLTKRFLEGFKWYSQLPNSQIVGMSSSLKSSISQAEIVAKTAALYGVPNDRILQVPQPTNTREEAIELRKNIDTQTIILSTSSFHIPRAKKWFEFEGFEVIPAPTDYRIKIDPSGIHNPWEWNWDRIAYWNILLHEWAGAFHYWLLSES